MEKLKVGDKIIITDIQMSGKDRYWSSSSGKCPQDIQLPYETTVESIRDANGQYASFGDGTYGFWTEKTTWIFAESNYEIF